eukprot:12544764-Alexandrium_andersonii.AAC.1
MLAWGGGKVGIRAAPDGGRTSSARTRWGATNEHQHFLPFPAPRWGAAAPRTPRCSPGGLLPPRHPPESAS